MRGSSASALRTSSWMRSLVVSISISFAVAVESNPGSAVARVPDAVARRAIARAYAGPHRRGAVAPPVAQEDLDHRRDRDREQRTEHAEQRGAGEHGEDRHDRVDVGRAAVW